MKNLNNPMNAGDITYNNDIDGKEIRKYVEAIKLFDYINNLDTYPERIRYADDFIEKYVKNTGDDKSAEIQEFIELYRTEKIQPHTDDFTDIKEYYEHISQIDELKRESFIKTIGLKSNFHIVGKGTFGKVYAIEIDEKRYALKIGRDLDKNIRAHEALINNKSVPKIQWASEDAYCMDMIEETESNISEEQKARNLIDSMKDVYKKGFILDYTKKNPNNIMNTMDRYYMIDISDRVHEDNPKNILEAFYMIQDFPSVKEELKKDGIHMGPRRMETPEFAYIDDNDRVSIKLVKDGKITTYELNRDMITSNRNATIKNITLKKTVEEDQHIETHVKDIPKDSEIFRVSEKNYGESVIYPIIKVRGHYHGGGNLNIRYIGKVSNLEKIKKLSDRFDDILREQTIEEKQAL